MNKHGNIDMSESPYKHTHRHTKKYKQTHSNTQIQKHTHTQTPYLKHTHTHTHMRHQLTVKRWMNKLLGPTCPVFHRITLVYTGGGGECVSLCVLMWCHRPLTQGII